MVAIDIGSVCKKLTGREAGRYCVIIDEATEGYVMITGPREITDVRRRQCNILHLEPTGDILEIKKGASDEEVAKALEKKGLLPKVARDFAKVGAAKLANAEAKAEKKEAKPKAKEDKPKPKKPEAKPEAKEEKLKAKEEKPKAKKAKKE